MAEGEGRFGEDTCRAPGVRRRRPLWLCDRLSLLGQGCSEARGTSSKNVGSSNRCVHPAGEETASEPVANSALRLRNPSDVGSNLDSAQSVVLTLPELIFLDGKIRVIITSSRRSCWYSVLHLAPRINTVWESREKNQESQRLNRRELRMRSGKGRFLNFRSCLPTVSLYFEVRAFRKGCKLAHSSPMCPSPRVTS